MKAKDIIMRVQELFEKKLSAKTGWGRNEIMELHRQAVNEALLEALDK